jgi:3-methyladenine DNA glycosylase/8-oxoguanine DNA glycosylase
MTGLRTDGVESIGLGKRAIRALRGAGVGTLADLYKLVHSSVFDDNLMQIRGVGRKTADEILSAAFDFFYVERRYP